MKVIAIAAMNESRVIGLENGIPWKIPGEQKYFAQVTRGHTVLMGRKTFDSLPAKVRPLPERLNIVITRSPSAQQALTDTRYYSNPLQVIKEFRAGGEQWRGSILWIAGGAQLYEQTVGEWDELYMTIVKGRHAGDAYFPDVLEQFSCFWNEVHPTHEYQRLVRR